MRSNKIKTHACRTHRGSPWLDLSLCGPLRRQIFLPPAEVATLKTVCYSKRASEWRVLILSGAGCGAVKLPHAAIYTYRWYLSFFFFIIYSPASSNTIRNPEEFLALVSRMGIINLQVIARHALVTFPLRGTLINQRGQQETAVWSAFKRPFPLGLSTCHLAVPSGGFSRCTRPPWYGDMSGGDSDGGKRSDTTQSYGVETQQALWHFWPKLKLWILITGGKIQLLDQGGQGIPDGMLDKLAWKQKK